MANNLVSGLVQLLSSENQPGNQNSQLRVSSGIEGEIYEVYPHSPQDPENTSIDDAVSTERRPMRVNPMWHFMEDRMPSFGYLRETMRERMTSYWNPQTRTWDNDRADGVTYGSSQYYNFNTGEYREPTEFELNPHKMNPMSPNFNPFGI